MNKSANPDCSESPDSRLPATGSYLIALATYNEIENLPGLVEEIHRQLPLADVLVVDDNSPDGTGQWCRNFQGNAEWFRLLTREGKQGLGSAIVAAMRWAMERNYRYLITLDADWSHPPASLPEMLAAAANVEIVVGSRYCPGGSISGWSWQRRWASRMNNWLSHRVVGLPSRDNSGNYRVYVLEAVAQLNLEELRSEGYAFLEEILWLLHRQGARFAEVPIAFTNRVAGASKIGLGEVRGKLTTLGRLTWRRLLGR